MSSHLYIHIPFCRIKCLYCDFYSLPRPHIDWQTYIASVLNEAQQRRNELPIPPETIYIGGGTPSLMPPDVAVGLLEELKRIFEAKPQEVTIELNPDDVKEEYIAALHQGGYNRFSMGVQSFSDECLRLMGRRHNARQARKAAGIVASYGNMSLDLIFGLPKQSFSQWCEDVKQILSLRPQHISCYSLMLEDGTALTRLVNAGRLESADETLAERMYTYLCGILSAAGYHHYEISNFALPDFESKHNSSYWSAKPYLGLGPGAHSYDGYRKRSYNRADVESYISGESVLQTEILDDEQLREEYIMLQLRTSEGLNTDDYALQFGQTAAANMQQAIQPMIERGEIEQHGNRIRIPENHWLTSDPIIVSLL